MTVFAFPLADTQNAELSGDKRHTGDARINTCRAIYKAQYVIIFADFDSTWAINGKGPSIG
jgi:hypothetical protein